MHGVFASIETYWAKAGRGDMHFVAAAFATNLAVSEVSQLHRRMRDLDENIDLEQLRSKLQMLVSRNSDNTNAEWLEVVDKLSEVKRSYEHYTEGHPLRTISSCPSCTQKPSDYAQSMNQANPSPRSSIVKALVDNIMHLVLTRTAPCAVIPNSSPVYADLGYVLAGNHDQAHEMRLQMALQTLNMSYCQFLDNSIPSKVSFCRLTALRMAQQAIKIIGDIINDKTCFPCTCTQTLANHLRSLETDLNGFVKHKCWDLYFQSPWVAGNHILEILDLCHYYGMKLFVYRHYIGAVVHYYNILQQLAGLERIPLLEHVCEQYKDTFFPGRQRPRSNFRSCWTRYVGARLKFKKGHKSRDHRDSWCMAVPAHAARKAAGLGICGDVKEERSGCMLFKIKQQDYHMTEEQRQVLSDEGICEQLENMDLDQGAPDDLTNVDSAQQQLTAVLPSINRYLTGTDSGSPTALLNHFAVFASCARIISSLSDASHADEKEKGMNCICFASAILGGADRIMEARRLGRVDGACWRKQEREGVLDLAMRAIREEMGEKEVKGWRWEI